MAVMDQTSGAEERVSALATAIAKNAESEGLSQRLDALAAELGDYVYEAVADELLAGTNGTYSQRRQDAALRRAHQTEIRRNGRIPIVLLSRVPGFVALPNEPLEQFLSELVAADVRNVPREVGLTGPERELWNCLLRGYSVSAMVHLVRKRGGGEYTQRGLQAMLNRVKRKVLRYPALGWRTCLAEDICRRKGMAPPVKVSWLEIIEAC